MSTTDNLWGSTDDDEDLIMCVMPEPTPRSNTVTKRPTGSAQPQKQKSWISSSFDDFDDFGRTSQPEKPSQASTSRKRSRQKENVSMPPPLAPSKGKYKPITDQLWADKYAPKTQADLAVHKKKIGEVEGWLRDALYNMRGGPLCLLTGPAGAGKTATIHVLAKEMGLGLQEWSNPVTASASNWKEDFIPTRPDFVPVGGFQSVTQAGQFREFLLRANRYPSLQLGVIQSASRKVILVEEVPHIFSRDTALFHDIIRQHCRTGISPLVFIFSDVSNGDSAERNLFPKHIQADLGICNISFNPIATTSMVKVLQKVASAEVLQFSRRFEMPSKQTLEALSAASAGDIRGAINALQFVCLRGCSDVTAAVTQSQRADLLTGKTSKSSAKSKQGIKRKKPTTKTVKKGKAEDEKEDHLAAIGGRDTSLFLFRALGKILYCKRGEPGDHPDHQTLTSHLAPHDRDPLLCVPEDVIEKCHLTGDFFSAYLHQNYMSFFTDIEDVVHASEYFSDADYLSSKWEARDQLGSYAASVASRGLIFSNSARARCSGGATSGLGWKPLHKPAWYGTIRKMRDNNAAAKGLFRDLSFICPPQELLTQVLPALLVTKKSGLRPGQPGFLQEVCRFTDQRYKYRPAERLDEKDISVIDPDDDDVVTPTTTQGAECGIADVTLSKELEEEEDDEPEIDDFDD